MSQLTVRELIDLLKEVNQDAVVDTEGCDCFGDAFGVVPYKYLNHVLLTREDGVFKEELSLYDGERNPLNAKNCIFAPECRCNGEPNGSS